ncbi:MAG: MauE/DoxX family redox-associated membrane protein [Dehalobacterium sp.]|jgi:uncharacterized membrane protein YphA (DoxX/SURF4 family)
MIFRFFLAIIYLYAGGSKIFYPMFFQRTILAYYPIPEWVAFLIAIFLPWLEILAALALLLNFQTKYAAGFLFGLSLLFFSQMVLNFNHLLPYGCGCFGFGDPERITLYHVGRDLLITVLAAIVWRKSRIKHNFS